MLVISGSLRTASIEANNTFSDLVLRNPATEPTVAASEKKFQNEQARWEYAFNYFAKDGKLEFDHFLDLLVQQVSQHAAWGKYNSDSEPPNSKLYSGLRDWSDFLEFSDLVEYLAGNGALKTSSNPHASGLVHVTLRQVATKIFRAVGTLATNNPNQISFSKEEFFNFCREWKKFCNLGK